MGLAKSDRIALAAPTGKAAQRLQASVSAQMESLSETIPALRDYRVDASTVHRLLYRARNGSLPVDAVILDEASMVDLPLMSRLVDVLPQDARLVVLGDAHQLASVQPGAVPGRSLRRGRSVRVVAARRVRSGFDGEPSFQEGERHRTAGPTRLSPAMRRARWVR